MGRDRPLYRKTILDSDCKNSSGKRGFQFTFHKKSGLLLIFKLNLFGGLYKRGLAGQIRPLYRKTILNSDCKNSSGKRDFQFTFRKISGLFIYEVKHDKQ